AANGNTFAVSAPHYQEGTVVVYQVKNGAYQLLQAFQRPIDPGCSVYFGWSIAGSTDLSRIIVGDPKYINSNDTGGFFTYDRNEGGLWTQDGPVQIGNGFAFNGNSEIQEGISAAISGDGNRVIIGGNTDDKFQGAVWFFGAGDGVGIC